MKTVLALKYHGIVLAIFFRAAGQTRLRGVVMKAKKALKRLAKIETLISDLTERYSKGALQIREALQDAKAAFGRAKEAVSLQASSGTVKKGAPARKKNAAKKALKSSTALTAAAPAPRTMRRKFSAAQREAAAERMRQRWAAKKAAAKATKKATSKSKKTAKAA